MPTHAFTAFTVTSPNSSIQFRSRFANYDPETGKASGGAASNAPLITTAATVIGVVGIGYYLAQLL